MEYIEPPRQLYAGAYEAAAAAGLGGAAAERDGGGSAKVLVLQRAGLSPAFVEAALAASAAADGRRVDFVVLPENAGPAGCAGRVQLEGNPSLNAFSGCVLEPGGCTGLVRFSTQHADPPVPAAGWRSGRGAT